MLKYKLNKTVIYDEDGKKHVSYGITYGERHIKDISTNKRKVKKLILLCNKLNLSPIHLDDVVDDFLVDFEA